VARAGDSFEREKVQMHRKQTTVKRPGIAQAMETLMLFELPQELFRICLWVLFQSSFVLFPNFLTTCLLGLSRQEPVSGRRLPQDTNCRYLSS
jgi:hypothetical protein